MNFASLRSSTNIGVISPIETRWLGRFEILRRSFGINRTIRENEEVEEFMQSGSFRKTLSATIVPLENFHSITFNLQQKDILPNRVSFYLDHICNEYPGMSSHLILSVGIVHRPNIYSWHLKIARL